MSQPSAIMTLNQIEPKPLDDDSTICTAATPPESDPTSTLNDEPPSGGTGHNSSSVPWPDHTFIIRCLSSGRVLTLLDGQVVLAQPGGRASIHWACVETKGWLGFRNPVSGKYLGHDRSGILRCSADQHNGWEHFYARPRPEGGYILLMKHWEKLYHVGVKVEHGVERLGKIGEGGSDGLVWEFSKVD